MTSSTRLLRLFSFVPLCVCVCVVACGECVKHVTALAVKVPAMKAHQRGNDMRTSLRIIMHHRGARSPKEETLSPLEPCAAKPRPASLCTAPYCMLRWCVLGGGRRGFGRCLCLCLGFPSKAALSTSSGLLFSPKPKPTHTQHRHRPDVSSSDSGVSKKEGETSGSLLASGWSLE